MKKIFGLICLISVLLMGLYSCQKGSSEKLLLAGSGWNKIIIIDKGTKGIEWEYSLKSGWECNSAVVTPDGNILFSYTKGAKLINKDHNEIWDIPAPEYCEMQTVGVLPDGNFLLAWCGTPAVIMEVDSKGNILKKVEYDTGIHSLHRQFRQICKNEKGNYMMPLLETSEVREISPEGETIRIAKLEGTPFTALADKNGLYWISCGESHSLMNFDFDNNIVVKRYGENDIQGVRLFFVAGLGKAAGNNLYVCNSQALSLEKEAVDVPQLIEIDDQGEIIWSLNDYKTFSGISSVCEIK